MVEIGVDRGDGVVVRQRKEAFDLVKGQDRELEGCDGGERREQFEECDAVFISKYFLCLLEDGIVNSSGDIFVDHVV